MFKKVSPNFKFLLSGHGDTSPCTVGVRQSDDGYSKKVEYYVAPASQVCDELPAPSNFDLPALLEAGVELREVDSNVLVPSDYRVIESVNNFNKIIENETSEN